MTFIFTDYWVLSSILPFPASPPLRFCPSLSSTYCLLPTPFSLLPTAHRSLITDYRSPITGSQSLLPTYLLKYLPNTKVNDIYSFSQGRRLRVYFTVRNTWNQRGSKPGFLFFHSYCFPLLGGVRWLDIKCLCLRWRLWRESPAIL